MKNTDKIVVFGASGLVGSSLINKLIEKGYSNIIGVYHSRKPQLENIILEKVNLIVQEEVTDFFEKYSPIDYVFFVAARVGGIRANKENPALFIYDNLAMALNVIHNSYLYGVKKLINLGSSCIYPKNSPQPIKESYLLTGILESTNESYAVAKISAIMLCKSYNDQYKTNFISLMPCNLYGPNDNYDLLNSHVLAAMIRKIHLGKLMMEDRYDLILKDNEIYPSFIYHNISKEKLEEELGKYGIFKNKVFFWGTGEVYREFMHVDDLAEAMIFVMNHIDSKDIRPHNENYILNVGTQQEIKLKDLASLISDIIGYNGKIEWSGEVGDGTPRKIMDSHIIYSLGWKPKILLEEGIKKVYLEYMSKKDITF